jgi:hypothetical protein
MVDKESQQESEPSQEEINHHADQLNPNNQAYDNRIDNHAG